MLTIHTKVLNPSSAAETMHVNYKKLKDRFHKESSVAQRVVVVVVLVLVMVMVMVMVRCLRQSAAGTQTPLVVVFGEGGKV